MKLTRQNQAALEKAGLPVSAENLYMMHQLGPKAAQEVIRGAADGKSKADMSPETQKAMNLNYGAGSKSAAEYIGANKKALDDRYAAVTKARATTVASTTGPSRGVIAENAKVVTPAQVSLAGSATVARPTAMANASAPAAPSLPAMPSVAEAPPVIDPMASTGGKPVVAVASTQDVGQDIRDRRIAHVVTGGLS